jgi:quinohemoprotein amine dehydrogenase
MAFCVLLLPTRLSWGEETSRTLLQDRCSVCHRPHGGDGKLDSIDFQRKTPEGWEMTLARMVRTHGVQLQAGEARTLIKYLSDTHGLAPAEITPFRYALEKRNNTVEKDVPKAVHGTCVTCHSYARIALQRRTPEFWRRLPDLTAGLLPNLENQVASAGMLDDFWYTVVKKETVPYLTKHYPFEGAAWLKWQAAAKPNYAGVWKVVGHDPGKGGDYTGQLTLKALGGDQYEGEFRHEFADGSQETGKTTAIVYTGFQWRGVAQLEGNKRNREIFFADETGEVIHGRRLLTEVGDLGREETLYRSNSGAKLLAVVPAALKAGETQAVKLFGMNLPQNLSASAMSLGAGVSVQSLSQQGDDTIVAQVTTEKGAKVGPRRAKLQGVEGELPLYIYKAVDYIRILPEQAFSRPGGVRTPKLLQQFEVVAYLTGADGKKGTQDDVSLGRVGPIKWNLEEYVKRVNDDDVRFVGAVDEHGLFTPANDGPNPQRHLSEANVGDVWVEAWYTPDGAKRPIGARAFLLVMPPKYNFQPIE